GGRPLPRTLRRRLSKTRGVSTGGSDEAAAAARRRARNRRRRDSRRDPELRGEVLAPGGVEPRMSDEALESFAVAAIGEVDARDVIDLQFRRIGVDSLD